MSRRFCPQCHLPVANDNHIYCSRCRDAFRRTLRGIPELLRELNITLSKQDRIGAGSAGGSRPVGHEAPLFYKSHASEARDALVAQGVVRWARIVKDHFVDLLVQVPDELDALVAGLPTDPVALLIALTDRAANYQWFGDMANEINRLVESAEAAIDLAQQRLEAGRCDSCDTRMAGRMDSPTVTCPGCGAVYQVEERQQQLYAAAQICEVTAAQAEVFLGFFMRLDVLRRSEGLPGVLGPLADQPFSGALVRQWARRGHLRESRRYVAVGITPTEGWPLYVFGDVVRVALVQIEKLDEGRRNAETKRAARAAAREARNLARNVAAVTAA